MLPDHATRLRQLLSLPQRNRIEGRREFSDLVLEGMEENRNRLTTWVASEIFFGVKVGVAIIEEVADQIEERSYDHLMDHLDGESKHPAWNLGETEALFTYCTRVAERANVLRNARNKLTVHKVAKSTDAGSSVERGQGNTKPFLLFALPFEPVRSHNENGKRTELPETST